MSRRTKRREMLTSLGAAGTLALAGCSGSGNGGNGDGGNGDGGSDGGGESYELVIGGGSQGGTTFSLGQALQRAASQHSDKLELSTQSTGGNVANIRAFSQDVADGIFTSTHALSWAINDKGKFSQQGVDTLPDQVMIPLELNYTWIAKDGSGVETTDDLTNDGVTIYPVSPGSGSRAIAQDLHRNMGMLEDMDIADLETSDAAGAMVEDRVDVIAAYDVKANSALSGWVTQAFSRNDVHYVEPTDEFKEAAKQFPPASYDEGVTTNEDFQSAVGESEVAAWKLNLLIGFADSVPDEAMHELVRLAHEENESIRNADRSFQNASEEPSDLVGALLPSHPVHEGAADYYKENDIWNDDLTT